MKKVFGVICLFFTITNCFASMNCCIVTITNSFSRTSDELNDLLISQLNSLNSLEKAINEHNKTLDKQDTQLNQKINLLKEENLRNRELLFYLKQKNNMQ